MNAATEDSGTLTATLEAGAMSPRRAAEFSGFSRSRIYEAMQAKELAYFERGRRGRLIAKSELLRWMATQVRRPAGG